MKRKIVLVLALTNVLGLSAIIVGVSGLRIGHAARGLRVSDLTYGKIDADGDGKCTLVDDWIVEQLLANSPHHIAKALTEAELQPDGVVDLSAYLLTVDGK
jgi:hypothetical protein